MAESNLGVYREDITTANDGIAIVQAVTDLPGGRTLEVAAYRESLEAYAAAHAEAGLAAAVYAGTPIGRTEAGEYLPFAVGTDGAFTTPAGATPVGVACQYVAQRMDNLGAVYGERFRMASWIVYVEQPCEERRGMCRVEDGAGRVVAEGEVVSWEPLDAVRQVRVML